MSVPSFLGVQGDPGHLGHSLVRALSLVPSAVQEKTADLLLR